MSSRPMPARRGLLPGVGLLLRALSGATVLAAVATVLALTVIHHQGRQLLIVTSGSMEPLFSPGDVVLVEQRPVSALRPDLVVTFQSPTSRQLTTHRIVSLRRMPQGLFLQTKGDANAHPDPDLAPASNVRGVLTSTVPYVGRWLAFYQAPLGRVLILGGPMGLMALSQCVALWGSWRRLRSRRPQDAEPAEEDGTEGSPSPTSTAAAGPSGPVTDLRARRRAVAAVVVATVAVCSGAGILLGRHTNALFTDVRTVSANTLATRQFCPSPSAYADAVKADGPSLWYRLDDPQPTTATDAVTGSAAGSYRGAVSLDAQSPLRCDLRPGTDPAQPRLDPAASFAGTSAAPAYLTTTAIAHKPDGLSLEVWFRTAAVSASGLLVGLCDQNGNSPDDRLLYLTDSGRLAFGADSAARQDTVLSGGSFDDGAWHHAVATLGADGTHLYADGREVASSPRHSANTHQGHWQLGWTDLSGWPGATAAPRHPFVGQLDEAAVYDTALSGSRVTAHWRAADFSDAS